MENHYSDNLVLDIDKPEHHSLRHLMILEYNSFLGYIASGNYEMAKYRMDKISGMAYLSGCVIPDKAISASLDALEWLMMAVMRKALSERAFK